MTRIDAWGAVPVVDSLGQDPKLPLPVPDPNTGARGRSKTHIPFQFIDKARYGCLPITTRTKGRTHASYLSTGYCIWLKHPCQIQGHSLFQILQLQGKQHPKQPSKRIKKPKSQVRTGERTETARCKALA